MNDTILFGGCILVFVAFGWVLFHFRTGLFGLTALCVFQVAAATLSAFFFAFVLGEIPDSFTTDHEEVWTYSILGLLAMIGGVYLGWRPLKKFGRHLPGAASVVGVPAHINERVGWLSFCVGVAAQVLYQAVWGIPTLSTAVNCVSTLARIGILILLVSALKTGRWRQFAIAIGIYGILSVLSSLRSGHTFLRMDTAIPLIVIYIASSGLALRFIVQGVVGLVALLPLVSAWLDSREIIRSGYLDNFSTPDKVRMFFAEFLDNLSFPTAQKLMEILVQRVDMTAGLANQVRHQPAIEPYAYGETVYSAFYTLIPRILWEDKPVVAGGSEFYTRFTGEIRPVDDVTSIGIAYPFELYANGGPVWVVIGLGVIGFLCARLELKLLQVPKNLGSFWALALVTAVLCDGGQRTDVVLPALVAAGIAAYVLGRAIQAYEPTWGILPKPEAACGNEVRF